MKFHRGSCYIIIWQMVFFHFRSFSHGFQDGVSFRAKGSFIEYHFSSTMSFLGSTLSIEFSTTSCEGDLLQVTSRDTNHFYLVTLEERNRIVFYYKLEDGQFNVKISPPHKTFCDGERHRVEFRRYGRDVFYRFDGSLEGTEREMGIKTAIFSKPDKIMLGGKSGKKFDGCIIDVLVVFQWKNKTMSVRPVESFLNKDVNIREADVFVGACSNAVTQQECTRAKTHIFMTTGRGIIASPRLNESYQVSRCTWNITSSPDSRLRFTVLLYKANWTVPCHESQVIVFEGTSTNYRVLERFCNVKSNTTKYSSGRNMMVEMFLPSDGSYLDFIALYEAVGLDKGPCPINRTLTGLSGNITSLNFPNNYGADLECTWIITIPQSYHILLSFGPNEFHIQECNTSCSCDFLEVRDDTGDGDRVLGKFCGEVAPSPIYLPGQKMRLRFVTGQHLHQKGFRAAFSAVKDLTGECPWNKTLTRHRAFIHSPRYSMEYPGDMDCVWRIHVSENNKVALVFLGPLNLDPNCADFIEVRDGSDFSSPLLQMYCASSTAPPNIFSTGRNMLVRFKSDSYQRVARRMAGFQATYFAVAVKSGVDFFGFSHLVFYMLLIVCL